MLSRGCKADFNFISSELLLVKTQVEKLNSSGTLRKLFFSDEKAEVLNGCQETLRTALEEMQVSRSRCETFDH